MSAERQPRVSLTHESKNFQKLTKSFLKCDIATQDLKQSLYQQCHLEMEQDKQLGSGFSLNPAGRTLHLYGLLEGHFCANSEIGKDNSPPRAIYKNAN